MSYFPVFIELKNRRCLVVGGGKIALHKVKVLLDFGAEIVVAAKKILPEIHKIQDVDCHEKNFGEEDLKGKELVVAATNDNELNRQISMMCKKKHILVNVVDQPKECSFIFPSYLKEGEVVAAFSSGGNSPAITQYLKEQMRPVMTPHLGKMASCLGELRKTVQQCTEREADRKEIYRELLALGLETDKIPSRDEIARIIGRYQI